MNIKTLITSISLATTLTFGGCSETTQKEINNNQDIVGGLLDSENTGEKNNITSKQIENITEQLNSPFIIKAENLQNGVVYYDFKKEHEAGAGILSTYFYGVNSNNINLFYINKDGIKTELKHGNFGPQGENGTMIGGYYYFENADSSGNIRFGVELKDNYTNENSNISNLDGSGIIIHSTGGLTNNSNSSIPNLYISKDKITTIESNNNSFYYLSPQENYTIESTNGGQFSINEYQLIGNSYSGKGGILRIPKGTNITIIKK